MYSQGSATIKEKTEPTPPPKKRSNPNKKKIGTFAISVRIEKTTFFLDKHLFLVGFSNPSPPPVVWLLKKKKSVGTRNFFFLLPWHSPSFTHRIWF